MKKHFAEKFPTAPTRVYDTMCKLFSGSPQCTHPIHLPTLKCDRRTMVCLYRYGKLDIFSKWRWYPGAVIVLICLLFSVYVHFLSAFISPAIILKKLLSMLHAAFVHPSASQPFEMGSGDRLLWACSNSWRQADKRQFISYLCVLAGAELPFALVTLQTKGMVVFA